MHPKIIVILGPTTSGKSELGVELAKKFDGEIISADSRQIYKELSIGSGKITKEEMGGIPHHLIDVTDLNDNFTVADFKKLAEEKINEILSKGKLPIIVGGTGFYIQAIVDGAAPPEVKPNEKLRKELEDLEIQKLFEKLQKLDPDRAETIDPQNKRRIIRAIEVAKSIGSVPKQNPNPKYNSLQIGLEIPRDKLKQIIRERTKTRLASGWEKELERIPKNRIKEIGLGYALMSNNEENLVDKITNAESQYAKRQMTWFKRDKRIKWFSPTQTKEIESEVEKFLEND